MLIFFITYLCSQDSTSTNDKFNQLQICLSTTLSLEVQSSSQSYEHYKKGLGIYVQFDPSCQYTLALNLLIYLIHKTLIYIGLKAKYYYCLCLTMGSEINRSIL